MPPATSDARSTASIAGTTKDRRCSPATVAVWILLALALAVAILRFQRISELPPGLHYDAGSNGADAVQVLQGEHALFFAEKSYGREWLGIYLVALSVSFLGRTELAVRLPTIVAGASVIFAVFWLGWLLFGKDESGRNRPWRGLLVGGVAAGLLAVSTNQTVLGRTAYRVQLLPLLLCLCLALFWWGWGHRGRRGAAYWRIFLAGACAGLLLHTYTPARVTPFLFLLFGLSFVLPFRLVTWGRIRAELPWIFTFWGAFALVAAPIIIYFALNPEHLFLRSQALWLFDPRRSLDDPFMSFLRNVWGYLTLFGFRGDPDWRHNFAGRPMLNLWEAAFFWLGVGVAARHWKLPANRLLLIWMGVMFLPATLFVDDVPLPNTVRVIGAMPAIYLLVGLGVWEASQFLKERFLPGNVTRFATLVGSVLGGVILLQGVLTYIAYFQKWAETPDINNEYEVEWSVLAKYLNAQPPNAETVYLIPDGQRHLQLKEGFRSYTLDYLYQGATPAYLFHTAMPGFVQKIESSLAAVENLSTVKVVEWNLKSVWTGDESERFAFLLGKYGRNLESEDHGSFRVHTYTDVSLDRPWISYDYLESLSVTYDGGIELVGVAVGRGQDQLSLEEPIPLGKNRTMWAVLRWQTAPGLGIDYAVSLRLRNSEATDVYNKDLILWRPDHSVTGSGGPFEQFDTWAHLEIPGDLLPGEYELRLVVYDAETLKPTVELGVWEPERTLARLQVGEVR